MGRRGRPKKYIHVVELLKRGKILRVTQSQYKAIKRYLSALRKQGKRITVIYEEGMGGEYRYLIPAGLFGFAFGEIVDLTGEEQKKGALR